ncbi:MAG: HEAT repeat domain-containing protein [Gemmatimonadetes bacterium]|nr:HEAT repeat domain-containing protein [Gemmatimonadota bacterium]
MDRRTNLTIWLQTLTVLVVYGAAIGLVHRVWFSGVVDSLVLALVLAFAVVQSIAIATLLLALVVSKVIVGRRERRFRKVEPVVRDLLVDWMTEPEPSEAERARGEIESFADRQPDAVERCAVDLIASISGSELVRLSDLLVEIGIVERWSRRFRSRDPERRRMAVNRLARLPGERGNGVLRDALRDPEASVRIEAARALLTGDGIADIERIFHLAVTESLLVRAVLVEDLRPHAIRLAEQAIPRALAGGDPREVVVALEMIEAWQKSLSVPAVAPLLRHPRPEVRARALRVVPYVSGSVEVEGDTLAGLADPHPGVRLAAARAAGRIGIEAAIPALERLLHSRDRELAVAAAYALAELGDGGADRLEAAVRSNHSAGAAVALEALERFRTDRLRRARV